MQQTHTVVTAGDPSASRLVLPRLNPDELRCHRFFLSVVAPALTGFLDAEFWLVDIPRACHADAAIWHAVVSLAAVYEADDHVAQATPANIKQRAFALQQYNTAIRLVTQDSALRFADKGRALTVSIIFSYISIIQGFYEQAFMHLRAGCALLNDISYHRLCLAQGPSTPPDDHDVLGEMPMSPGPIRNILLRASLLSTAFGINDLLDTRTHSHMAEDAIFWSWWYFSAPNHTQRQGSRPVTNPENIFEASRAAESLVAGLVCATSPANGPSSPDVDVEKHLADVQSVHVRGYRQLQKALRMFDLELATRDCGTQKASQEQLRDILHPLRNYLNACRVLFVMDPEGSGSRNTVCESVAVFEDILRSSVRILSLGDTFLDVNGKATPFTLNSTTIDALALVAQGAPSQELRRTAARLLQRPNLEGIWNASMAGKLADVVLDYESDAMASLMQQLDLSNSETELPADQAGLARVAKADLKLVGSRKASVGLQTLNEVMSGQEGKRIIFDW